MIEMTKAYYDSLASALIDKRIVGVILPEPDEPFDCIELVLDDGNIVRLDAVGNNISPVFAWGINVPGDDTTREAFVGRGE